MEGKRIGLIVPCDMTQDAEYWEYLPDGVTLHITRTGFYPGGLSLEFVEGVSAPTELRYATRSLAKIDPDVVCFACTSGSFIHGAAGERDVRRVLEAAGARLALSTSGALVDALWALGVRLVALATPYPPVLGELLRAFLEEAGFEVTALVNKELADVVGSIETTWVENVAQKARTDDAEAIVVACTGLPTLEVLGNLEGEFGIPVLSANQVTMWACLGAIGLRSPVAGHRLLQLPWRSSAQGGHPEGGYGSGRPPSEEILVKRQ